MSIIKHFAIAMAFMIPQAQCWASPPEADLGARGWQRFRVQPVSVSKQEQVKQEQVKQEQVKQMQVKQMQVKQMRILIESVFGLVDVRDTWPVGGASEVREHRTKAKKDQIELQSVDEVVNYYKGGEYLIHIPVHSASGIPSTVDDYPLRKAPTDRVASSQSLFENVRINILD